MDSLVLYASNFEVVEPALPESGGEALEDCAPGGAGEYPKKVIRGSLHPGNDNPRVMN
jgi:hypothetical protein